MDRRRCIQGACALAFPGLMHPGARAADGVTEREIVLGQSGILSGPLGGAIKAMTAGVQAAFEAQNAAGGVNGRQLRLVSLDDELDPAKAVANYKRLLQGPERVLAMFACVGSATTAAAAPVLQESGAVMVGGYAVADSVRQKAGKRAYFVRATNRREADLLVRQLTTIGITQIAMAHLDNPGGTEALGLLQEALKAHQLQPRAAAAIKGDGSNVAEAAKTLADAQPQAVIMYLGGKLPGQLMKAVRDLGARPGFYGMSIVSGELAAQMLGDGARGLAIAQVVPYPWWNGSTELQPYQRTLAKSLAGVNYYTLEGWINAQVMMEALRRCGRDLTRERLAATMDALKMRTTGLEIDFSGEGNTGSRFVELVQVRADGSFIR